MEQKLEIKKLEQKHKKHEHTTMTHHEMGEWSSRREKVKQTTIQHYKTPPRNTKVIVENKVLVHSGAYLILFREFTPGVSSQGHVINSFFDR